MDVVDLGPGVAMRGPPVSAPADEYIGSLIELIDPSPVDDVDPMLDLFKPTLEGIMKLSGLPGMPCDEELRQIFLDISQHPTSSYVEKHQKNRGEQSRGEGREAMYVVDLGPGVGGVVVGEAMRGPPLSAPADPFDDSLMQLMHPLPVDGVDPMLDLITPTLEGVLKLSGLPGMPCDDEVLRQIFLDISRPPSSS